MLGAIHYWNLRKMLKYWRSTGIILTGVRSSEEQTKMKQIKTIGEHDVKDSCETGDKKEKYCEKRYKGYHCTKKPLHKGNHHASAGDYCTMEWKEK